jgi:hypothetical protein
VNLPLPHSLTLTATSEGSLTSVKEMKMFTSQHQRSQIITDKWYLTTAHNIESIKLLTMPLNMQSINVAHHIEYRAHKCSTQPQQIDYRILIPTSHNMHGMWITKPRKKQAAIHSHNAKQ